MKDFVEASSLAAEAYRVVRQRIVRGELALGQVISRRTLAKELGMSFLPVSEALQRLEIEGLLESRPRAGTRIRIPSREDVRGHYTVREALEVQAAILFSQAATPGERNELRKLAARVDAVATQPDRTLYVVLHERLHRRIAECARCPTLCEAIEKTHALAAMWFRVALVTRHPTADDPPRRHSTLVETLSAGTAAEAADAVRAHMAVGLAHTLEQLEPYFRLRHAHGETFHRSEKKQRQQAMLALMRHSAAERRGSRATKVRYQDR